MPTVIEEKTRLNNFLNNKKILTIEALKSKANRIEWYMTDWCNYRCSYCRTNHEGQKLEKTEYYIEKAEQIKNKLKKNDKYLMYLKGGEVSFIDLQQVLKTFNDYNVRYKITTNLSNTLEYYVNLINHFDMKLTASYHSQSKPQEFIEKITYLNYIQNKKNPNNKSIEVSLVSSKDGFDECYQYVYDKVKDLNINVQILPLKFNTKEKKINNGTLTAELQNDMELANELKTKINYFGSYFSMLQLPSILKDFSPKGYKCQETYYLYYNKDHFEGHRCQKDKEENIIICKKDKCDFCHVERLWK